MTEQKPQKIEENQKKIDNSRRSGLLTRRDFLRAMAGGVAAGLTAGLWINSKNRSSIDSSPPLDSEIRIHELISQIESLSLEELELQVFHEYPVIPNIESMSKRINQITIIEEGSTLMKAGTSVAVGLLESIYAEDVDQSQIDLGIEQYKLDLVLRYLQIAPGSINSASVIGTDVNQLLHDPLFCTDMLQMNCPPNMSVIDAYIENFDPSVSINFFGTNAVRYEISLEDFATNIQELIDHYVLKGVIPILTTFPHPPNSSDEVYRAWFEEPIPIVHPGQTEEEVIENDIEFRSHMLPQNALKYNLLLLKIAERNQIPIINLERGVVESALHNGTRTVDQYSDEIDPEHFSQQRIDFLNPTLTNPLHVPPEGELFQYGEEAVSYFVIQTLYGILLHQQ